jgi:hypothetical protein
MFYNLGANKVGFGAVLSPKKVKNWGEGRRQLYGTDLVSVDLSTIKFWQLWGMTLDDCGQVQLWA